MELSFPEGQSRQLSRYSSMSSDQQGIGAHCPRYGDEEEHILQICTSPTDYTMASLQAYIPGDLAKPRKYRTGYHEISYQRPTLVI